MKIAIHFFSGCGNTQWVALQAQKQLVAGGHEIVLMQNVQEAFPNEMPQSDVDLFLSPVYFGGLPANVVAYYKRLPMVASRKAVFWSVCGASKGIANWLARSLLMDRGYDVIDTKMVVMPDTFLFLALSQKSCDERLEVLQKAQQTVADNLQSLVSLPEQKKENPLVLFFVGIVYFLHFILLRHALGMMMVANSKCTHCGLCANNCPVHAIQMKDGKPAWNTGCVNCFACLNHCPAGAIDFSWYALLCGAIGAVAGLILLGTFVPLGFISKTLGLFLGFFAGTFIFAKCTRYVNCDNALMLKNKKRVLLTDQEKNL